MPSFMFEVSKQLSTKSSRLVTSPINDFSLSYILCIMICEIPLVDRLEVEDFVSVSVFELEPSLIIAHVFILTRSRYVR